MLAGQQHQGSGETAQTMWSIMLQIAVHSMIFVYALGMSYCNTFTCTRLQEVRSLHGLASALLNTVAPGHWIEKQKEKSSKQHKQQQQQQ